MYCGKCGREIENDAAFCGSCGASTSGKAQRSTGNIYYTERNTGLTVLLSLIWIGAGHLYVGQIGKGIGIMVVGILFVFLGYLLLIISGFVGLIFILLPFVLYIWSIFDAYGLAKEYNSALERTGSPPW